GSSTDWASVSCGGSHTVALKSNKTLWAWGYNGSGQLGDGTTTNKSSPVQIGVSTDWARVSCGNDHTIAIKSNGALWAWGGNNYGQLGYDLDKKPGYYGFRLW
ncbi:MAG TPA: chromosome condensation regulator RCC1, partial [Spirochaetota bacterium]|nr:chromosome condensation regulator RCC1 [Spirochaetota bacterium]